MTTSSSRKHRGYRTQKVVADYLKAVFPFAESAGAGRQGKDILNTPGYAVEVKARTGLDLPGWLRQAETNAGDEMPMLVVRLNGQGEASVDDWAVVMRFKHARELISNEVQPEWVDSFGR